jgi:hypothetical protein
LEEGRPRQRRMGKASYEGHGPPRAVELIMMMMECPLYRSKRRNISVHIDLQQDRWDVLISRKIILFYVMLESVLCEMVTQFLNIVWMYLMPCGFHIKPEKRAELTKQTNMSP